MITLAQSRDINWQTLERVAYENERLALTPSLLSKVDRGRQGFVQMLQAGTPCYGVTTGLGWLADIELTAAQKKEIAHNVLRARAVAFGPPFEKPVVRAAMLIRLVNFLSGRDGVRAELCEFLVARLNEGFTPWVPKYGHGMAADAIANTHAFQTLIGEGYVLDGKANKQRASDALAASGVQPFELMDKEGLALVSGLTVAPAYAFHSHRELSQLISLANMVAAASMEGLAACKDTVADENKTANVSVGTAAVVDAMQPYLVDSQIAPATMQAPVSYRVIPQIHGALLDAMRGLRACIERTFIAFTGNPLMVVDDTPEAGRLLSVGLFHDQHLVNQIDHIALALAHVGCLSQRRLHRLLDKKSSGLTQQLANRPGLDAGLVVTQKGSLGLEVKLRQLAQPVSLSTGESSAGQEDYMTMALPALSRLLEMMEMVKAMLAYELLTGLTAIDRRGKTPGKGIALVRDYVFENVKPFVQDRAIGTDIETILKLFDQREFQALLNN